MYGYIYTSGYIYTYIHFCVGSDSSPISLHQLGKHETIVTNVFPVLLRLAPLLAPPQRDHLLSLVQKAWGVVAESERLLLFLRRLGQDDKQGEVALKVVELLWQLARDAATPDRACDLALAHQLDIIAQCALDTARKSALVKVRCADCIPCCSGSLCCCMLAAGARLEKSSTTFRSYPTHLPPSGLSHTVLRVADRAVVKICNHTSARALVALLLCFSFKAAAFSEPYSR